MIKNVLLTGDTHGRVEARLKIIKTDYSEYIPSETAIIILGDSGINYYQNKSERRKKEIISAFGYTIYCVRGNHEERPENISTMREVYDNEICGLVYMEEDFPLIKYLVDGGEYVIKGHSCLVIGGAYSVDKQWRLERAKFFGESFSGWFADEQLSPEEMELIENKVRGKTYDFVFSHTAPIDWEPTDLFLNGINQSLVDKSMEYFLQKIKSRIRWGVWCFGHYHADRIERPYAKQFFTQTDDMEQLWNLWYGEKTYLRRWWLSKSPWMERWENSYEGQEWLSSMSHNN